MNFIKLPTLCNRLCKNMGLYYKKKIFTPFFSKKNPLDQKMTSSRLNKVFL